MKTIPRSVNKNMTKMLNWNRMKSLLTSLWSTRSKVQPMEEQKLIRLNKDFDGPKRRPMTDAKVLTPWYLPYRTRSMLVFSIGCGLWLFSGFIGDIFRSTKRGWRLEQEREKFLKQLDEEDRFYEMRLNAARERMKNMESNQSN